MRTYLKVYTRPVEPTVYELLHEAQRTHWWYAARRRILQAVLERVHGAGVPEGPLYDLGCGVGANLSVLERFGPTFGVDFSESAVRFCHERGHSNVILGRLEQLDELPSESASIVLLADVIEHLEDERSALGLAHQLLLPGGAVIVTVPAYQFLWSRADEIAHHYRRYTEGRLRALLSEKFELEWSTYFNTLLFGMVAAGRFAEKILAKSGEDAAKVPKPLVNRSLQRLFALEAHLIDKVRLPFGVSVLCVARKRS